MIYQVLLLALLVSNVMLRVFTNEWNMLPRIFNVADVGIVGLLALLTILGKYRNPSAREYSKMRWGLFIFCLIGFLGTALNLQYIYLPSAISQLIMWIEPIVLFLALVNIPFTYDNLETFRRLLLALIVIEFFIGVCQVPIFLKTGASETIIGTFNGNAEQYAAFILLGMFYLLGRWDLTEIHRAKYIVAAIAILMLIILVDNKASWVAMLIALFYLFFNVLAVRSDSHSKMRYVVVFFVLIGLGYYIITFSSNSLKKYSRLYDAWQTDNILNIGKVRSVRDAFEAYAKNPHMILVGSGLGTFYSRAAFQYFLRHEMIEDECLFSDDAQKEWDNSNSMGGVISQVTNIEPFFRQFYRTRKIFPIGSGTADNPCTSYTSLLGEVGIIGTIIYLSFYVLVFKKLKRCRDAFSSHPRIFPFTVATIGFFVYLLAIGGYNYWLECGRINTILWSMIAVLFRYAFKN